MCIKYTQHANVLNIYANNLYVGTHTNPHVFICILILKPHKYFLWKTYTSISLSILLYLCSWEFHFWLWLWRVLRLFISLLSLSSELSNDEIQNHILSKCAQLLDQLLHYYFALMYHLLKQVPACVIILNLPLGF